MRLQHVSIPRTIDDEEKMRAFYGGVLELSEIPVPTSLKHLNLMWFKLEPDAELHIFVEPTVDGKTERHFCLIVDDIEPIRKNITDAGHHAWDVEPIPGRPRFFCHDPVKNVIEFASIDDDYMKYQDD